MSQSNRPASGAASGIALPRFIPLKVHSAYSLLEGALPISKLAKLAPAFGYPAIALTDTNNMFGVLEFSVMMHADVPHQDLIASRLGQHDVLV